MGAEYLFCMKSIETHARAFLAHIILPIGTVSTNSFRGNHSRKYGTCFFLEKVWINYKVAESKVGDFWRASGKHHHCFCKGPSNAK